MCGASDKPMKFPIQQHHSLEIARHERLVCTEQNVAYCYDFCGARPLRGEPNREYLVEKSDLDDLNNFVEIDGPHHDAFSRLNVDKALHVQSVKRLVNRRSSNFEKSSHRRLAQLLPRLECAGDDTVLDRLVGLFLQ